MIDSNSKSMVFKVFTSKKLHGKALTSTKNFESFSNPPKQAEEEPQVLEADSKIFCSSQESTKLDDTQVSVAHTPKFAASYASGFDDSAFQ